MASKDPNAQEQSEEETEEERGTEEERREEEEERRAKELETDLANMRKPRTTSTDIQIFVTSKTNTIRPLNKQDITNQRHIVFWIGKSMPKIVDKWNVWYTIHIEIKKLFKK